MVTAALFVTPKTPHSPFFVMPLILIFTWLPIQNLKTFLVFQENPHPMCTTNCITMRSASTEIQLTGLFPQEL